MTSESGPEPLGQGAWDSDIFELRLYVAGQSPRSVRALENLRKVCDEHLAGRYNVEVIDLHDSECIEMMSTFIREHPELWNEDIGK